MHDQETKPRWSAGKACQRFNTRRVFLGKAAMEKQHLRGKKRSFRLETGFFSDSIHGANAKDNFELWHSPNL
jgi:hypothetical protein